MPDQRTAPPHVDFSQRMVVVVAMGDQPGAGYGISVTRFEMSQDVMRIHIRVELSPSCGGGAAEVLQPVEMVSMPASRTPITIVFIESVSLTVCEP